MGVFATDDKEVCKWVVWAGADAPSRAKGPIVFSLNHQAEGLCLLPEENELLCQNGLAIAFVVSGEPRRFGDSFFCRLRKATPV